MKNTFLRKNTGGGKLTPPPPPSSLLRVNSAPKNVDKKKKVDKDLTSEVL